tara:strand:- start:1732 stop:1956 length:225 start_codon:yes stop_codon:yes gene_type:complete
MKTFQNFIEDNMAALQLALAKHKYKKGGGKVDKQPEGPTFSVKGRKPDDSDDDERGKAISDYRKKKWKEKKRKK